MSDPIANFQPHPDIAPCKSAFIPGVHKTWYKFDYLRIFKDCQAGVIPTRDTFHKLIKEDLFFLVYFVAGWESDTGSTGNKPFVVERCRMVEEGPQTATVDIWAREHAKSTCITVGRTIQRILNDPECTTAIFSYKAGAAGAFLDSIRKLLELPIMQWAFPDICWKNTNDAPSWSLQGGIRVQRKNTVRKEHTVQAFGLVEGMPTGGHWDHLIFDDVETDDMAQNPDQLELCFNKMQMAYNLGREGGTACVIGTFYSHCGVLTRLQEMKDIDGKPMYKVRIFPGTDDGTINGAPVFFSQEYLDGKKTRPGFATQILCNPTPGSAVKLKFEMFKSVNRKDLPPNRIKFVIIDPAGDEDVIAKGKSDKWAMLTVSINPDKGDHGLSDVYIEDGIVDFFALNTAISAACSLYRRSGKVSLLAIERVGQSSHYSHVKKALEDDHGVYLGLKKTGVFGGNLLLLSPGNRNKNYRIESALSWPLINGKLHIVDDLEFKEQIRTECEKFPFYHVDILDALAYLYDILADPTTPMIRCQDVQLPVKPKSTGNRSAMCA